MNTLNSLGVISGDMPQFKASNTRATPSPDAQVLKSAEAPSVLPTQSGSAPNASELKALNALLQIHQQHLSFSIDEGSGATVMKVVDTESGDIIRQMPSESWLKLAQELSASSSGLLNDRA